MVNMQKLVHVYHYLEAVCQLTEPFVGDSAPKWGGKVDVMELFGGAISSSLRSDCSLRSQGLHHLINYLGLTI